MKNLRGIDIYLWVVDNVTDREIRKVVFNRVIGNMKDLLKINNITGENFKLKRKLSTTNREKDFIVLDLDRRN